MEHTPPWHTEGDPYDFGTEPEENIPVGPADEQELDDAVKKETWSDAAEAIGRLTELQILIEALEKDGKGSKDGLTSDAIKRIIKEVKDGQLSVNSGPLTILLYEPIKLGGKDRTAPDFEKIPLSSKSLENGTTASGLTTIWNSINRTMEAALKSPGPSVASALHDASESVGSRLRAGSFTRNPSLIATLLAWMTDNSPISETGDTEDEGNMGTESVDFNAFDWPENA